MKKYRMLTVLMTVALLLVSITPLAAQNADYPREVEHFTGTTVIEERPTRIYDISYHGVWAMLAFGETPIEYQMHGDRIEQFIELRDVLGADINMVEMGEGPNIELILEAEPDLILGAEFYTEEIREQLEAIAPVVDIPGPGTGGWRENVRIIGDVLAMEEEAVELIAAAEAEIADALSAFDLPEGATFADVAPGLFDGLVYVCQDPTYAPVEIMLAAGLTMTPEVANLDGGVCTGLSLEVIAQTLVDTDVLIFSEVWGTNFEEFVNIPVIASIPAIEEGRYYLMDGPSAETTAFDVYAPALNPVVIPILEEIGAVYDGLSEAEMSDGQTEPTFVTEVPGFPPFDPSETMLEIVEDRGDTLVVRHAFGETEIPKNPERIYTDASILPTGILLDIPIVGTEYYPDMPNLPIWEEAIAGVDADEIVSYDFNYEKVLSLQPDLVIAYGNFVWTSTDPESTYEQISQIAPTLVLMDDPVAYYEQAALDIGTVLGVEAVEETIDAANADIIEACQPLQETFGDESVALVIIWGGVPSLQGILYENNNKFVNVADSYWLYGLCGITPPENLPDLVGNTFALDLNGELLPQMTADHIIVTSLGDDNTERLEMLAEPLWQAVPAAQAGNVYVGEYFSSYSHDTAVLAIRSATEAIANAE